MFYLLIDFPLCSARPKQYHFTILPFWDVSTRFYYTVCYEPIGTVFRCVRISIKGLVRRSVGWLVGWSVMLSSKSMKNGLLRILNDLDIAG